ncbi:gag-pol polyprotein, partial [Tanacetum coccineum]
SKTFQSYILQHGILHESSCVYRPAQNEVAECKNRHLLHVFSLHFCSTFPRVIYVLSMLLDCVFAEPLYCMDQVSLQTICVAVDAIFLVTCVTDDFNILNVGVYRVKLSSCQVVIIPIMSLSAIAKKRPAFCGRIFRLYLAWIHKTPLSCFWTASCFPSSPGAIPIMFPSLVPVETWRLGLFQAGIEVIHKDLQTLKYYATSPEVKEEQKFVSEIGEVEPVTSPSFILLFSDYGRFEYDLHRMLDNPWRTWYYRNAAVT